MCNIMKVASKQHTNMKDKDILREVHLNILGTILFVSIHDEYRDKIFIMNVVTHIHDE